MACLSAASATPPRQKPESKRDRLIYELYAGLDTISKYEDEPEKKTDLEDVLKKFQKFFSQPSPRRIKRLLTKDIYFGKIEDWHRQLEGDPENEESTDIKGDSLLLRVMSIPADEGSYKHDILDVIKDILIKKCPRMIVFPKKKDECQGITPLHIAILKEDTFLLKQMANALEDKESVKKEEIKSVCARGPVFQNTTMMAGTLLGVAALKFNEDIFSYVYENFAYHELDHINGKGDNIVHSLIKYAHAQPDKMNDALKMLNFIMTGTFIIDTISDKKRKLHKLLMMKNKEKLTALQVAAKRQQYAFFEFIMQHQVYHSKESSDGLYSEEVFDITEIETLAIKNEVTSTDDEIIKSEYHESVLEYLVHHQTSNAFRFADFLPVREVIKEKWEYYKWWFWGWFAIHLIFMTFLSIATIHRSKLSEAGAEIGEVKFEYLVTKNGFVTAVSVAGVIFGLLYLVLEIARHYISRFQYRTSPSWTICWKRHFTSPYSNFIFRIYFALFYLLLFVDFVVSLVAGQTPVPDYHNHCLIFAVIIGWYLFMFFLQGFKAFSFFTVLIQRIMLDMVKFAFVMLIFLVAFSIAMFMIMQGASTDDDDFNHFGKTMVKMLTIMVGIGEIGSLFQARQPILAIIVFVLFVIFTTILLLNALIALMSNSCTDLMSNSGGTVATKMHCRLQKLSVILFLESYLPRRFCKEIGVFKQIKWYENNEWVPKVLRRFWSLSSIHENYEPVHSVDKLSIVEHFLQRIKHEEESEMVIEKKEADTNTTEPYMEQSIQRRVDIKDMTRHTCNACKSDEVVVSESQEVLNSTVSQ